MLIFSDILICILSLSVSMQRNGGKKGNETKKAIPLWKHNDSEFIARVDRKTGKTQRLAHHANHVSALMALYTDWPEMVHAMHLIGALHDAGKLNRDSVQRLTAQQLIRMHFIGPA